ncbi:hypothetical protein COO55_12805 [Rhodococcus opacus]|jgi:hypothetical protein|nr:hypothetical protein COO55_12805 [Rhodococcus opacus]
MQSHTWPVAAARFDDPNLVSTAGLVPVMALAQASGLLTLADQHLSVPDGQRCPPGPHEHFMRNVGSAVSSKHVPPVMAAIKTIFAHTEANAVVQQWDQVADTLNESFPKVASMMRDAKEDVLAFRVFLNAHWAEGLVEQFDRTAEQGDQTPRRRRGNLPEPGRVLASDDGGGDRGAR